MRTRTRATTAWLACLMAGLSGCGLLLGIGDVPPVDDAGEKDSGHPMRDASPDSRLDSHSPRDADAGMDATTDTSFDTSAEATSFCARNPGHTLCDDFDEPGFADVWSRGFLLKADGSSVSQDPEASVSPPDSLRASLPESTTAGLAELGTLFSVLPSSAHLEFDLQVVTTGTIASIAVASFSTKNEFNYTLTVQDSAPVLHVNVRVPDDGGAHYQNISSIHLDISAGQWHRVTFDVGLSGTDGGVTLSVADAGTQSGYPPSPLELSGTTLGLDIGAAHYGLSTPYAAWTVLIDNVIVDLE
jgi:hypothetical protein